MVRVQGRQRRKRCRCSPGCFKKLAYSTRLRHYRLANVRDILPSDGSSSGSSFSSQDQGSLGNSSDESNATSEDSDRPDSNLLSSNESSDEAEVGGERLTLDEIGEDLRGVMGLEIDTELWRHRNDIITETDRDDIRAFKLKMFGNVTRRTFNQIRHAFRHKLQIRSENAMVRRIALLAGIETIKYDCCINSHILFTGEYEKLDSCPFCHEARYTRDRKARRSWNYIPLIPRLKNFYQNLDMIEKMSYRDRYKHDPARIRDVFDSAHYRTLLGQNVVVDGIERPYTYFCDGRDIAFGLSVDGFLLYKRRRNGPSATPIILQNYNLPPQIRTHLEYLICLGIIHKPKDLGSFLVPFDEECAQLARGVKAFDASVKALFALRAYVILEHGDIVAIEEMLGIRGHNGYCPCRSCLIKGVRNITNKGTIYYVPLTTPDLEHQTRPSVDPRSLDLRTHDGYLAAHAEIASAPSNAAQEMLSKNYGIRHLPLLNRVSSIDFAVSFPWEWLHIFCENIIPNLVDLWCGNFKGLDVGTEDYEIHPNVWKEIGSETANAVKHIPSSYVNVLPNIAKDRSHYTAETWAFWFIYVAPIVLKGRFKRAKYYKHLCLLAKIMKTTLKFELSLVEIDELEEDIIKWVERYEKYYYQYQESRLSTCVLTIHGLLHIPNDIRAAAPTWATWTFYIERFCGILQRGIHSRRNPAANMDKRVLYMAYLSQLGIKYDLDEELSAVEGRRSDEVKRGESVSAGYPDYILRSPCVEDYRPGLSLQKRIVKYFRDVLGNRYSVIAKHLPDKMRMWRKMRIRNGGDTIRAATWFRKHARMASRLRNNSYVRYEVTFNGVRGETYDTVNYGVLERILELELGIEPIWGGLRGTTQLLAEITPWRTEGEDAALCTVSFERELAPIITDLSNVRGVVGRVESRGQSGIVDRNMRMVRATFAEAAEVLEEPGLDISDSEN